MADASQAYANTRLESHRADQGAGKPTPDYGQHLWKPNSTPTLRPEHRGTAQLVRAIETEVLPRLLLARRPMLGEEGLAPVSRKIGTVEEVTTFTDLVLEQGMAAAGYIDSLRAKNVGIDQIYLRLLAPAARRLGDLWVADLVDFTQVTIGVGHLQLLLRQLGAQRTDDSGAQNWNRRALLLPAAGEQHSFGLVMVAEFFRRAGWDVCCDVAATVEDSVAMVREQSFSIFGLSLSGENRLDATARQVRAMRRASKNPAIGALVGGQLLVEHPEYVSLLGADAAAFDGQQAVAQANNMLGLLAIQC
jgi:methanogenic corrinoid protein MtbC1